MMEDGSFAITDADGRYHFEGVVPGTHVVQVSRMTLPEGARMIDCSSSTRNAGSTSSRFAIGQGGSLVVADFHAIVPENAAPVSIEAPVSAKKEAAPVATDFLALGDGEDGFLNPTADANPRAPAIRVAIRHRRGQSVQLFVDGKPVDPLAFDGTQNPEKGRFAVSQWRGVPLVNDRTVIEALWRSVQNLHPRSVLHPGTRQGRITDRTIATDRGWPHPAGDCGAGARSQQPPAARRAVGQLHPQFAVSKRRAD
jgi:hypothetical protein